MKIIKYLKEVATEVGKVVFPTREELTKSTIIVFSVCAFFALVFWGINSGVLFLLKEVF